MSRIPSKITVRVGCHMVYQTSQPAPILLVLRPQREGQKVKQEIFTISTAPTSEDFIDMHGNVTRRAMLQPGQNIVHHDALVSVTSQADNWNHQTFAVPVDQLPSSILRYTLPSRYCDSDKLLNFAWQNFGLIQPGVQQVIAICNWVHHNIEYRFGAGRPDTSASDIIAQRFGVCRDFAHVALTLCRACNLPARYVVGHMPDIGFQDPGSAMDFHAYFEVYLGGTWCTFDARFNVPRIGRVKVAQGLDAVDGAFSTIYGEAYLTHFEVWAYQVDPLVVSVGDPVDLSKRLDGTPTIRYK